MSTPDFPPEAVCAEEGCDGQVTGVRPSRRDLILEEDNGTPLGVLAAGEYDEGVCAQHEPEELG